MNQILFTNRENKKNNKIDVKKVIIVFSIAIIVIGVIIAFMKIYGLYTNKKKVKNYATPQIAITRIDEESNEITIKVTCEDGIEYLIYTWNNQSENRINLNGSANFERILEIPKNAMNNLKIEAKSTKGVTENKTELFESNIDRTKPTIDSETIVDKKLSIQASDDEGIDYLSYKWENEDAVEIKADENDNKTIKAEIDIKRGTYKLEIKVVDINGNEEIFSRLITGVNEPEIEVIKYNDTVHIKVTHDKGFKAIEFVINRKKYVYDEEFSRYDKNQTTVEFDFPLEEGENIVQVYAYSLEKMSEDSEDLLENYASKIFAGKCTYEQ